MQINFAHTVSQRTSVAVNAQLQQAIHLLAMGNSDLESFIEQQAEENPFLELARPTPAEMPRLPSSIAKGGEDWDRIGALAADPGPSLYAHVTAQIAALELSDRARFAAQIFLDALEPSGWLGQDLDVIAERGGLSVSAAHDLLLRLQKIEPAGLFARNLAECLRLQVAERGLLTPRFEMILQNLPLVGQADFKALARLCACSIDDLRADLRELRRLNPKPGAMFETFVTPERAPDLIITRSAQGDWQVDLNNSTLPQVVVSAAAAQSPAFKNANAYVGERLSVARWLARAVEHRNQTILKVGVEVARRQKSFLEQGASHLRPMVLREVADAIGMHESTVSRVTTGMLVATPQGTFSLKSFFSVALNASEDGGDTGSAAAVRHKIRQLIQDEDPNHPLSDDEIARIITAEGIALARRTVAKYREMLGLSASSLRKRQAALARA